jgi:hypothetical protein
LAHMSISTYFKPNIHQNGPEILGVKPCILSQKCQTYDYGHYKNSGGLATLTDNSDQRLGCCINNV